MHFTEEKVHKDGEGPEEKVIEPNLHFEYNLRLQRLKSNSRFLYHAKVEWDRDMSRHQCSAKHKQNLEFLYRITCGVERPSTAARHGRSEHMDLGECIWCPGMTLGCPIFGM